VYLKHEQEPLQLESAQTSAQSFTQQAVCSQIHDD